MNLIEYALPGEWINALGWTMLHSFWQAAVIALIVGILLYRLQGKPSWQRYWIAHLGWFSIIIGAIITFFTYYHPELDPALTSITRLTPEGEVFSTASPSFLESSLYMLNDYFNRHLPLIVSLWAMGMVFFLLRFLGGLIFLQHLRSYRVRALSADWEAKLSMISRQLGLRHPVQLLESALVKVPMVIGWVKPVILLPIGALNALSSQQVEAILAHELAHIKRHDYLLNLIRSLVEVLFYFNPAVWWLSARIRTEREHCCDDMALEVCGDSLSYVRALVALQELNKQPGIGLAMTLVGKKPELLNRVRRILNQPKDKSDLMEKLLITCLLLVCLCFTFLNAGNPGKRLAEDVLHITSVATVTAKTKFEADASVVVSDFLSEDPALTSVINVTRAPVVTDTIPPVTPAHDNLFLSTLKDGKKYQIRIQNQKITRLVIDGLRIPEDELVSYYDEVQEILDETPEPPAPPRPPAPIEPAAPVRVSPPPMPPAPPVGVSGERPDVVPVPPMPPAPPKATVPAPPSPPAPDRIKLIKPEKGGGKTGLQIHREVEGGSIQVTQSNNWVWRSEDTETSTTAVWVSNEEVSEKDHIILVKLKRDDIACEPEQNVIVEVITDTGQQISGTSTGQMATATGYQLQRDGSVAFFSRAQDGEKETSQNWRIDLEKNLMSDRLLEVGQSYQVELSGDQLLINGEAQSKETHKKYLGLLQGSLDEPIGSDAMYFFNWRSKRRME